MEIEVDYIVTTKNNPQVDLTVDEISGDDIYVHWRNERNSYFEDVVKREDVVTARPKRDFRVNQFGRF